MTRFPHVFLAVLIAVVTFCTAQELVKQTDALFTQPVVIKISRLPFSSSDMADSDFVIVGQANGEIVAAPFSNSSLPQNVTITTQGMTFVPNQVSIPVGSCVTWTNLNHDHNVVQVSDANSVEEMNGGFKSGTPNQVANYTHCFNEPGDYFFICQVHVSFGMRGMITVTDGGSGSSNSTSNSTLISIASLFQAGSNDSTISNSSALVALELHPDFATNGIYWIMYTLPNDNSSLMADHLLVVDEMVYTASNSSEFSRRILQLAYPYANHNGRNNLLYDRYSGLLMIALGDGGNLDDPMNLALSNNSLFGKLWSFDFNSSESANCSVSLATVNELETACSQVFAGMKLVALGLRSPVGLASEQERFFITDHGLRVDEVHAIARNSTLNETEVYLGWNLEEGGVCIVHNDTANFAFLQNATSILPVAVFNHTNATNDDPDIIGGVLLASSNNQSSDQAGRYFVLRQEPPRLYYIADSVVLQSFDLSKCVSAPVRTNLNATLSVPRSIPIENALATRAYAIGSDQQGQNVYIALGSDNETALASIYVLNM